MILQLIEKILLGIAEEALPVILEALQAMVSGKKMLAARRAYEAARRIALIEAARARLG